MNNYAMVLGVDKYKNAQELPSCENDANLMEGFLKATGKYEVLRIPNDASKHEVQELISSFVPADETEVGEVLFYFSGHGSQDEKDMHYVLRDTDTEKISSTSFNNDELDNIIRKCSPKLYVKIIDACQSGVLYIKGPGDTIGEPERLATKGFGNCIFIYSSLRTQASLAGNPYSEFTRVFIDAVKNVSAPVVKFSDIQNYLSDNFSADGTRQTPYFSTQCDGTEVFCEKNASVLALLEKTHPEFLSVDDGLESSVDTINTYLSKCRDDSAVKAFVGQIHTALADWEFKHELLSQYYEYSCESGFPYEYHKYHEEPSLVKMLYDRVTKENLFVEVESVSEKKDNPLMGALFASYHRVPVSYRSLANQLPEVFSVHLKALDSNLPDYVMPFIFVYSPTFFYVFTCTKQFVRKGWKEYESARHTKYVYTKFEYDSFSELDWERYQSKRLSEAFDFIEKTLLEYVEGK